MANSFIHLANENNVSLSLTKLQAMLYYVCNIWEKQTNTKLLSENFIAGENFHRLMSVDYYFGRQEESKILPYMSDVAGKVLSIRKECDIYPYIAFVFFNSAYKTIYDVYELADAV